MGQFVVENAHLNTDKKKFNENYDHIFNREKCECVECLVKRNDAPEPVKVTEDNGEV